MGLLGVLLGACTPAPVPEGPVAAGWPVDPAFTGDVEIRGATVSYYEVSGHDDVSLFWAIQRIGPRVTDAARGAATTWDVRWEYPAAGDCPVHDIRVTADIRVTIPRWTPGADAPARSVGNWQRYVRALGIHEQGHVDLVLAIARAMPEILSEAGCAAVDARGRAALDEILRTNKEYDRATADGASQGATLFPPAHGF